MAAKDPAVRHAAAVAGGRARVAQADPAAMTAVRRAGAATANDLATLARRIAEGWPAASRAKRAEVRAILAPLMPRERRESAT